MSLVLYERLCADDRRPSPFCWRARFALAHKGLAAETRAIKFTEAERLSFSGQGKVPVLVDGERVVWDSWSIAGYLEEAYPEAPSLFGGPGGRELARFVNLWSDTALQPALAPILSPSLYEVTHPDDRAYYKETREARWGRSFADLRAERARYKKALAPVLAPLRARLVESPYLCGAAPAYADYIVFSDFQWARCVDPEDLLGDAADAPIRKWRDAMLGLFDGLARRVPAFDSAA